MKSPLLLSLIVISTAAAFAQAPLTPQDEAKTLITRVGQTLVPERRLAVYSIDTEMCGDTLMVKGETTVAEASDSLQAALSRSGIAPLRCDIEILPHASLGAKTFGVVTVSTAPLRRGPDVDQEMTNQGIMGEPVTILKEMGLFTYIQLSDGYVGYMMGAVAAMTAGEFQAWQRRPKLVYLRKWGEIRSEKNNSSYPVADIVLGARVAMVKKEGKWLRVALPDGREGYLRRDEVQEEARFNDQKKPKPVELVHTARQFTGYPYLWGGRSSKGLDCSGLTKTVYMMHGINLPRDANMQVKAGSAVAFDSAYAALQPGDLLFFGRSAKHITHVGMYIGSYRFIHAGEWVRINSLNPKDPDFSARRAKDLQAVRRIL